MSLDLTSYALGKKAGGGGGTVNLQQKSVTVTTNGSQNVTADSGYDGLSKVALTTNVQPTLQTKSVSISSNGTTTVSKDNNYDGMTEVSITTNVQPTNQSKSVTITENTTTTISPDTGYDGLSSVEVTTNVSSGGTEEPEEKDVNFYDYDGTRVYSYTASEFANLTELPANPTHDGLTAQGWNWTLSNAKTYVASYGILDIGQNYITDDGKTRLYISIHGGIQLRFCTYLYGQMTIDWGDGTTSTISGSSSSNESYANHTYSNDGDYIIKLSVTGTDAIYSFGDGLSSNTYNNILIHLNDTSDTDYITNIIKKIEIGANFKIGTRSFKHLKSLETITISNTLYNNTVIAQDGFSYCTRLKALVIPSGITKLMTDSIRGCTQLKYICLPDTLTTLSNYCLNYASDLKRITIPSGVTTIPDYCFQNAGQLSSISLPNDITRINQYALNGCHLLGYLKMPTSLTGLGQQAISSKGIYCIDFSNATAVPSYASYAISGNNYFKVVVPDELYEEWIATSGWSGISSYIISKSNWDALQNN